MNTHPQAARTHLRSHNSIVVGHQKRANSVIQTLDPLVPMQRHDLQNQLVNLQLHKCLLHNLISGGRRSHNSKSTAQKLHISLIINQKSHHNPRPVAAMKSPRALNICTLQQRNQISNQSLEKFRTAAKRQ